MLVPAKLPKWQEKLLELLCGDRFVCTASASTFAHNKNRLYVDIYDRKTGTTYKYDYGSFSLVVSYLRKLLKDLRNE